MYDYFETEEAVYKIYCGKHWKHLKAWDDIPAFKYHYTEISLSKYAKAYRAHEQQKRG